MLEPVIEFKLSKHIISNNLTVQPPCAHLSFLAPEDPAAAIEAWHREGQWLRHLIKLGPFMSSRQLVGTFKKQKISCQIGFIHGKEIIFLHSPWARSRETQFGEHITRLQVGQIRAPGPAVSAKGMDPREHLLKIGHNLYCLSFFG